MGNRTEQLAARRRPRPDGTYPLRLGAPKARPVSAFVVDAAYERAEQVIDEHRSTLVPSDYFDRLLAALDEAPHVIPELVAASQKSSPSAGVRAVLRG